MEDNYTFNVDIETQKSTTSVASLRKEVKELKNVLLTAEQGTKEYNAALEQLGSDLGQIKDVNELAKASTKDFGQQMANVTGTLKGISGGVQAITGGLSLMGVEMGDDIKIVKTLTSLMSMTQGIAAVESGIKAFKGLTTSIKTSTIAQKGLNAAMKANPIGFIIAGVAALAAVVATFVSNAKEAKAEVEALRRETEATIEETNKLWENLHKKENSWDPDNWMDKERQRQVELKRTMELEQARGVTAVRAYDNMLAAQKRYQRQAKANADRARELENTTLEGWNNQIRAVEKMMEGLDKESQQYKDLQNEIARLIKRKEDSAKIYQQTYAIEAYWNDQVAESEHQRELAGIEANKKAAEAAKKKREEDEKALKDAETWLTIVEQIRTNLSKLSDVDPTISEWWDNFADKGEGYISSADISPKLLKVLGLDTLTQEQAEKFWAAMLDGNDQFLTQYEQRLIKADQVAGKREDDEVVALDRQKKINAERIRILQNEIEYYNFTKNAEDDYLQQTNRALISALENEQKVIDAQKREIEYQRTRINAERNLAAELKEVRDEMREDEYTFWNWQYENAWSTFEKKYELRQKEIEKEQEYWECIKALAEQANNESDLQEAVENLDALQEEINNLNLDKSKATFKAWGDSVVKILGNVSDVMSSLMSYYATVTDEAIADLEDKLEQGIIDQEEYDKKSEELKKEQFERNKNFQLAQAVINGAAGIVQIIGDSSLPSYWAKLAAIAATIATTGLEIATINAQHYHPSGGGGGGNNNPGSGENWINVAPAYQMNDGTGQAEMAGAAVGSQLNSQRVYILESDIQSSNRRVQVRESNTRF